MKQYIYEWGNKDNQTLVFLHGLGSTGLSFGELATYLSDFHVISFDLPGHGRTEPLLNAEDYLPSKLAGKIDKVLSSLDKSDIILIGHSWGSNLGLYYASMYPENIKGLILLDGGYIQESEIGQLEDELIGIEQFLNSVRFPSWEVFIESEKEELGRWSEELEAGSRSQVEEKNGELRMVTSIFTAQSAIEGMYAEPTEIIFSKITVPVLLLRSTLPKEMEELRIKASDRIQKKISQLEICTIPNTTHDIYKDAPEEVAKNIKYWIEDIK